MSEHEIFFVGRRVRIRLSGECNMVQRRASLSTGAEIAPVVGHPAEQDGREGIVIPTPAFLVGRLVAGHDICIHFDPSYRTPEGCVVGGAFAASELVPLDADGNELLHPALARFER